MSTMIVRGKEIIRICPTNPAKLEYSVNEGRSWIMRVSGNSTVGNFNDLLDNGKELLGTTNKGLFYSINDGRSWILRRR